MRLFLLPINLFLSLLLTLFKKSFEIKVHVSSGEKVIFDYGYKKTTEFQ
jgi:hypothetical protein